MACLYVKSIFLSRTETDLCKKEKKRGHRSSGKEGDQASSVNLIYICTTENGTLSMILYGLHRGRPLSLPTVRHKLTSQCTQVKAFCKPETLTGSEFLSFFVLYSRLLADFLSHLGDVVLPREVLTPGAQDLKETSANKRSRVLNLHILD